MAAVGTSVMKEVSVICRARYSSKPSGQPGAVARAWTPMALDITTGSFGNDHRIGWPLGTGGIPTG